MVTSAKTAQAMHRSSRALVARALMQMHERDELEDPEQWSWQRLDCMPVWCLLQPDDRRQLQRMCGLLVNAPAICRWLDGRSLRAVHKLLGKEPVEQVLEQVLKLEIEDGTFNKESEAPLSPDSDSVDLLLLESGGSVLRCSLDSSLPLARLADTLEDGGMNIPRTVAQAILNRAHSLLPELCDSLYQTTPVQRSTDQHSASTHANESETA